MADNIMRTLEEFDRLLPEAKLTCVWENGYHLASRLDNESVMVKMYQVGGFFVEIGFRSLNEFEIIHSFRDPVFLLPYVDQIDLNALLE
ncbi:MAG: hypothetical protein H7Z75_22700 [Ferruginibacter sp.]|nr:hypothetical protein [Cytophagales bacterium]